MNELVALVVVALAMNSTALVASRGGRDRLHALSFAAGLAGLISLSASLLVAPAVALSALAGGAPTALTATAIVSFTVLVLATLASAALSIIAWRHRAAPPV